jgi:hypothetical protein
MMRIFFRTSFCLIIFSIHLACGQQKYDEPEDTKIPLLNAFESRIAQGEIQNLEINEASGLAYSRVIPNALWTHNDSGDKSRIFLIDEQGKYLGKVSLKGMKARDWEEITIGPGPQEGKSYIYISETGDNRATYKTKYIYRFLEPKPHTFPFDIDIQAKDIDKIAFEYPDGKRDSETLLIDPLSKDIFVISKREDSVRVYIATYPQKTKKTFELKLVSKLHFSKAVAGDISKDGSEILIKNYANVYYWKRKEGESIAQTLQRLPQRLPYVREPQGEAICWKPDGSGFFTLSEEAENIKPILYFYGRKP